MSTPSHRGDDLTVKLGELTISRTPKDPFSGKGIIIDETFDGGECDNCPELCPGFSAHAWRKTCQECKCPRECHVVYHAQLTSAWDRFGFQPDGNTASVDPRQMGYTWVPPGILTPGKIHQYFDMIPSEKVPKIGTQGERFRDKQLVTQLPKQDLALNYCQQVEESNRSSFEDFVAVRNETALDWGHVMDTPQASTCVGCRNKLSQGEMAVSAPKFREQLLWHPQCFKCFTCDELLVDLTYCAYDEQIFCERHYAEMLKPRCNCCDELIFSEELTKVMATNFHSEHFCCWQCDERLTSPRFMLSEGHPYCINCYDNVLASVCEKCNKKISIDSLETSYHDRHWHEKCCYCCVCKIPIGVKGLILHEQEIYCHGCYEEQYAVRCIKCKKNITVDFVTYENEPWHRECFTCTHCQVQLAGQSCLSRDERPYCVPCFGELFAKRCTIRTHPATK